MTSSTPAGLRSAAARLVAARSKVLVAATAVLVVIGIIAVLTDHYGLAIATVLLLQAAIAGYLVTSPSGGGVSEKSVQRQVDAGTARTLADLARARAAILEAVTESRDGR